MIRRTWLGSACAILGVSLIGTVGCGSDEPTGGSAASGGSSETATGGDTGTGGATGGSAVSGGGPSGGTASGGAALGGAPAGGALTGGSASGGASTGGSASGGTATETGGSATGGTATQSGGSGGGSGDACDSDRDCTGRGMLCDLLVGRCVPPPVSCESNDQCASASGGRTVCDTTAKTCVICVEATSCPENNDCVNHQCVRKCGNSLDCVATAQVCDTTAGRCVDCNNDPDCPDGMKCGGNACHGTCAAAGECASPLTCNTTAGYCTRCLASQSICVNNGVAVCAANGNTYDAPTPCGAGVTCVAQGNTASCGSGSGGAGGGAAGGSGGLSEGGAGGAASGGSSAGGAGGGCSPATFDPCQTMPHFAGTQVVDGQGDDLCDLPHFEYALSNSKFAKNAQGIAPLATLSSLSVRVVVRLGWSSAGIHMFAEVHDSAVHGPPQNTGELWNGDSIELMVAAKKPETAAVVGDGPPANDGPYQAIFSGVQGADGAAASYQSAGLPESVRYKSASASFGYVVEALIPWSSATAVVSGQAMGFDFGINDAETTDNQRDYYGALAYTCSGDYGSCGEPYNNAQSWCSPTAQ